MEIFTLQNITIIALPLSKCIAVSFIKCCIALTKQLKHYRVLGVLVVLFWHSSLLTYFSHIFSTDYDNSNNNFTIKYDLILYSTTIVSAYSILAQLTNRVCGTSYWNATLTTIAGTLGSSGTTTTLLSSPYGIFLDGLNRTYVVDTGNNRIQRFSSGILWEGATQPWHEYSISGSAIGITVAGWYTSPGSTIDQFKTPTAVYVDVNGSIYVVDSGNYRVRLFTYKNSFKEGVYNEYYGVFLLCILIKVFESIWRNALFIFWIVTLFPLAFKYSILMIRAFVRKKYYLDYTLVSDLSGHFFKQRMNYLLISSHHLVSCYMKIKEKWTSLYNRQLWCNTSSKSSTS